MHKYVDGKQVPLTQAEIDAFNARTAAWEASKPVRDRIKLVDRLASLDTPTIRALEEAVDILLARGVLSPEDFTMDTNTGKRLAYERLQERKNLRAQL